MRQQEQWKWIKGFENKYLVSTWGRVVSMPVTGHSGGLMTLSVGNSGYLQVSLRDNSKKSNYTTRYVHRLVAEAFIDNPEHMREVDHIDGNKLNNNVDNLEWVSSGENKKRAYAQGLYPRKRNYNSPLRKAVIMDGTTRFESLTEAAHAIGTSTGSVCRVLKGERNHTHHHTFEYAED